MFVIIAFAIKLDDGGSVFFRHTRVGQGGVNFGMWKFRTMVVGADRIGIPLTVAEDARITRLGRFLRRYRIDEFPQLINVLIGDMSIVGPRPEAPKYAAYYAEWQKRLHAIKPGITDPGTVTYLFEETRVISAVPNPEQAYLAVIMPGRNRLSLAYAERAGVRSDIMVILQTIRALIAGPDVAAPSGTSPTPSTSK